MGNKVNKLNRGSSKTEEGGGTPREKQSSKKRADKGSSRGGGRGSPRNAEGAHQRIPSSPSSLSSNRSPYWERARLGDSDASDEGERPPAKSPSRNKKKDEGEQAAGRHGKERQGRSDKERPAGGKGASSDDDAEGFGARAASPSPKRRDPKNRSSTDRPAKSRASTDRSRASDKRRDAGPAAGPKKDQVEEEDKAADASDVHPAAAAIMAFKQSQTASQTSEKAPAVGRPASPAAAGDRPHPTAAAFTAMLAARATPSSGPEGGAGGEHPLAAALKSSRSAASDGPPASPFGLRPVFKAGDFEKAKLNRTGSPTGGSRAAPDARAPSEAGARASMDEVRQQAITDAKRCSKEATEIYPFLRVSGDWVARNKELLRESGVTHVLNMAHTVCRNYHEESGEFEYLALDVIDSANESITPFLLEAIVFIEKARKKGGCCYVHCHMGVSRSCTVVIAYVMLRDKMSFKDAFDLVKGKRPVCSPNAGFLGQLQAWEKTLTHMPEQPQLYRVAPHSQKDPALVVKLCVSAEDATTAAAAHPNELDARGLFLLHDFAKRKFYLWVGPRCLDPKAYEKAANKFGPWMIDLLPSFRKHKLVRVSGGTEYSKAFWVALGVDERDAAEMTDADVDQDIAKYNAEYSSKPTIDTAAAQSAPGPQSARGLHSKKSNGAGPSTPGSSRRVASPASSSSGRSASKNSKFKVLLFGWVDEQESDIDLDNDDEDAEPDPGDEWDRNRNYDVDDLVSESMFVLLVHDRELAKKSGQGRRTIHKAYVWIGSGLEGRLNEQAGVDKAQAFVDYCCQKAKSGTIKVTVEHDEKESPAFWEAFEAGF